MLVFRLNLLSRVLAVSAREIRHLGEIKTSQLCPHKGEIRHAGYKPLRGWRTTCMFPATHPYPDQHHSSTSRATNCCPAPALTWVGSNSLNCKILLSQVFVGRQAARRQLCRSKGSVSSTRGPEVSNWRQKPFAPKHAQCNAVMLLAQLHQVGNRDEERKKASSQRDLRHPSYHSRGAAPLSIPACSAVPNPPGTFRVLAEGNLVHSKVGGKLVAPYACCCWLQEPWGEYRRGLGCRCPRLGERIESHSSSL